eukprot:CAMPEP_0117024052 /NCGR_PEP_ID=MMETSP0472-20121206/17896_1 /TAXON_ID=693140 ORGANISM="Tiarina fusus, Strain LIS" /NCGR_SAMPLE_ID=MMETSP0472 /ASSEMBLY_ACC=CAM_ASM_000603 /LENGTH=319 /DNA_ID=CAMNT_0004730363 /DNA_START=58 /DNA_END=1017 /DNA_ORIENTATION=+
MTFSAIPFQSRASVRNAHVDEQIMKLSDSHYNNDDASSTSSSDSSYGNDDISDDDNSGSESSWDDDMDELMDWFNGTIVSPHSPKPISRVASMPVIRSSPKVKLIGSLGEKSTSSIILNRLERCGAQYFQSPDLVTSTVNAVAKQDLESPEECIKAIFKQNGVDCADVVIPSFLEVTEEHINAHNFEITVAARRGDLAYLQACFEEGKSLQCCNRHGESIVHIVCRRGWNKILKFMIEKAGVKVMVKDDVGRTPLHDAAWTADPNFKLVKTLLTQVPEMMHVKDSRNHTPLSYVPRQQWGVWCTFLKANQDLLLKAVQQ